MQMELETMPGSGQALARVEAWFAGELLDRPPVRFSRHNVDYAGGEENAGRWPHLKARWYDEEYQVGRFLRGLEGKRFLGETFPVFWPNLGPNVFAGCYGSDLRFGEVTSWAEPIIAQMGRPVAFDWSSEYLAKLESMTRLALEHAPGRFLVGYTDLHPGIDWLAALRGSQALCLDLFDDPDAVQAYLKQGTADFLALYDRFDALLKAHGQPSVSWMDIPVMGRMHIPSCDFATMISTKHFRAFVQPWLAVETQAMTHNVFHMDGKGIARHLDAVLELPNVQAIQWVQGVGDDLPIMQWVPLIQRIQAAGKGVVVDLDRAELDAFMEAVRPQGIFLCLASESEDEEIAILKKLEQWK